MLILRNNLENIHEINLLLFQALEKHVCNSLSHTEVMCEVYTIDYYSESHQAFLPLFLNNFFLSYHAAWQRFNLVISL